MQVHKECKNIVDEKQGKIGSKPGTDMPSKQQGQT